MLESYIKIIIIVMVVCAITLSWYIENKRRKAVIHTFFIIENTT